MIGVHTNILIHAHRTEAEFHALARDTVTSLAEGRTSWTIPWPAIHEFLAIVTNPRVFNPPTPMQIACEAVEIWMESPTLELVGEDAGHWSALRGLLETGRITGARVHDARVAALCLQHGVTELLTADRDFNRFPGLRTRNPLVSP